MLTCHAGFADGAHHFTQASFASLVRVEYAGIDLNGVPSLPVVIIWVTEKLVFLGEMLKKPSGAGCIVSNATQHWTGHPSRLVATESDYDGFLSKYPLLATYLANQLITKTAVFVGYSLEDPDFRQIWHVVSDRLGRTRRKAYTLSVNAKPADIARWERRGLASRRDVLPSRWQVDLFISSS